MSLRTLPILLEEAAQKYPGLFALHQPAGSKKTPKYQTYTWTEFRDIVREVACGLHAAGIAKGDIVALDCETRAEFYFADLGAMANGCISAALYTSLPAADLVRSITNSEAKAIFVEDAKTLRALREAGAPSAPLLWILLTGEEPGVLTLAELRESGRAAMAADAALFEHLLDAISPEDPAVLYVTSGATGEPKMGLATHRAIVSNLDIAPQLVELTPSDCTLVFLPSAHIAQRIVGEFLPILFGMPVYFSEGLAKMPVEIRTIGPTFLLAPPRVWERVFSSITTEIKKRPAVTRRLFYGALGLGLKAAHLRHEGRTVPGWMTSALRLADRLVFAKVRQRLGGRLRIAISGAAPLGQDLAHFFEAIGLPLVEGYGLTEGGVVALNPIATPRSGSIGKALPGVEVRLAEDGELLIKSPTLFSGYFNDVEATKAVLRDGWLYTGDI
ncbi:MAG: AMP-binding protein, partial [Bryobacteraceae bacterium]